MNKYTCAMTSISGASLYCGYCGCILEEDGIKHTHCPGCEKTVIYSEKASPIQKNDIVYFLNSETPVKIKNVTFSNESGFKYDWSSDEPFKIELSGNSLNSGSFSIDDIGEIVFLTKEDAKKEIYQVKKGTYTFLFDSKDVQPIGMDFVKKGIENSTAYEIDVQTVKTSLEEAEKHFERMSKDLNIKIRKHSEPGQCVASISVIDLLKIDTEIPEDVHCYTTVYSIIKWACMYGEFDYE